MYGKKNSVLFTKTECLILSPDSKLLDESQVLLNVPRHDNMYSFDLKNIVPSGGLTCLFAKAIIDESNLWHRRLGHINFKTMNKLVRGNLRGLPSKLFENDHTCVACQKGKQHKASYKTKHPLGKFDGKADEGFFVGYSINSKAFRVFYTRTRKVEENMHITFLENKPNVAGSGPDWLFDIDLLTNSMKYEPITAGNQTNKNAEDAVADDAGKKTNEEPANEGERNGQEKEGGASNKEGDQNVQDFRAELDNLIVQQKQDYANSTYRVSTVSPSVSAARKSFTNADDLPTDPIIPDLEDTGDLLNTGIFSSAYDDKDEGAEADLNNLETTMNVCLIPTTRIHKDHPKDQIIRVLVYLLNSFKEDHEVYLKLVLELLKKEKLFAKFSKRIGILPLPDGPEDFVVYCNASNQGLGCVLMQRGKSSDTDKILVAQGEASKEGKAIIEMLRGLDQQMA
ncbi:ribonuclease H-like domain-containing protein [Tanacetum coccineum]|uniref:Ribonuclease H-like domain-containing protein n=1 Tax=Tanacetum coccineum TaxID=301880 RepID=A0ABQ5H6U9_9ASTR